MSIDKNTVRTEYEKGGYTYQSVADKFNISVNTVKSWAKRDKDEGDPWIKGNNKKVATIDKKLQLNNKVATKKEKVEKPSIKVVKDIDKEIVEEVLENNELTDKQKMFCLYYIKYFNATKAYQKAYECSYTTAMVEGHRLLRNPKIDKQIQELKESRFQGAYLEAEDIYQMHVDIVKADVTDFSEFGVEKIAVMDHETGKQKIDEDGNPVFYKRSYMNFKDSSEVDGTLISEIKMGKDGPVLKLHDKRNSLNFLTAHKGLMSKLDEDKLKIAQDKLELEKSKVENDKQDIQDQVVIVDDI